MIVPGQPDGAHCSRSAYLPDISLPIMTQPQLHQQLLPQFAPHNSIANINNNILNNYSIQVHQPHHHQLEQQQQQQQQQEPQVPFGGSTFDTKVAEILQATGDDPGAALPNTMEAWSLPFDHSVPSTLMQTLASAMPGPEPPTKLGVAATSSSALTTTADAGGTTSSHVQMSCTQFGPPANHADPDFSFFNSSLDANTLCGEKSASSYVNEKHDGMYDTGIGGPEDSSSNADFSQSPVQSSQNPSKKPSRARVVDLAPDMVHRCPFEDCSKSFAKKYNLKIHVRRHTGELPFVCEIPNCGKRFMWHSSFARHQKSHERRPKARRKKQPDSRPPREEARTMVPNGTANHHRAAPSHPSPVSVHPTVGAVDVKSGETSWQVLPALTSQVESSMLDNSNRGLGLHGQFPRQVAPDAPLANASQMQVPYSMSRAVADRGAASHHLSPISDATASNSMQPSLSNDNMQMSLHGIPYPSNQRVLNEEDTGNTAMVNGFGSGMLGIDLDYGNLDATYSFLLDSER